MSKEPKTTPSAEPACLTRQRFVQLALGGVGLCYVAGLSYPVYRYLGSSAEKASLAAAVTEVTLKDAHKLAPGTAMMFKFGASPALLIHHQDDSWVALTAVCTHLGCTVEFEAAQARIRCACHGGVYDARSGANISGPPPKPLKRFVVKVTENAVQISKV